MNSGLRDSILITVKKILGITVDYTQFDTDLIIHINTVLSMLNQFGVGPQNGFSITGPNETWSQFLGNNALLEMVKSYVGLKVRLIFDPPTTGAVNDSIKNVVNELEFRILAVTEGS